MAKVIRAVPRGGGDSNAASLPDIIETKVKPDSRRDAVEFMTEPPKIKFLRCRKSFGDKVLISAGAGSEPRRRSE